MRFTIGALLGFVTGLCILLSWIGCEYRSAHTIREKERLIVSRLPSSASIAWAVRNERIPSWMILDSSRSAYERVVGIWIGMGNEGVTLDGIENLEALQSISLGVVQPKDLSVLAGCKRLEVLRIEYLESSSSEFAKLTSLKELRELQIRYWEAMSNDAVKAICGPEGLNNLRVLQVGGQGISDEACVQLTKLEELESLSLEGTLITGEGISQLDALKNLRLLCLSRNRNIGDSDVGAIGALRSVEILDLSGCENISWIGVQKLRAMPQLKELYLPQRLRSVPHSDMQFGSSVTVLYH